MFTVRSCDLLNCARSVSFCHLEDSAFVPPRNSCFSFSFPIATTLFLLPAFLGGALDEFLNGVDCVTRKTYFIRSRSEVLTRHLQRRPFRAIRVDCIFNPTPNRERDKHFLGRGADDGEHGLVMERGLAERGDVEKSDFVCSGCIVFLGEGDGFAEVADCACCSRFQVCCR